MSEEQEKKPKVEGKKPYRPARQQKKEFASEVVGLTTHTFDIGHPKYAAKYERSVDAIARYVQEQYKSVAEVALAMRELVAPTVKMPVFPTDPNDQEALQIWKLKKAPLLKSSTWTLFQRCSPMVAVHPNICS